MKDASTSEPLAPSPALGPWSKPWQCGFVVPHVHAGATPGWSSEAVLGAQIAAGQLPLIGGWPNSVVSLATYLLLVLPLLKCRWPARLVWSLLLPLVRLVGLASHVADEAAIVVLAALGSLGAALGATLSGIFGGGGGGGGGGVAEALGTGPKLLLFGARELSSSTRLQYGYAALYSLLWSPLKEEVLFRHGLQRALSIGTRRRDEAPATDAAAAVAEGSEAGAAGWRAHASPQSRLRARRVASLAFGLAHLPASASPAPLVLRLPLAVSSALSAYFCFGVLYERRGLSAAVGAHAAHNLLTKLLQALQPNGVLGGALDGPLRALPALIPAAIYAAYLGAIGRDVRRLAASGERGRGPRGKDRP